MNDRKLIIIGTGDHARVLIEAAAAAGWRVEGCVAPAGVPPPDTNARVGSVPLLGSIDDPGAWVGRDVRFVVAIGDPGHRRDAYDRCRALGIRAATVVHPTATLLGGSALSPGSQVCAAAVVGVDARVGVNVIVNTGAIIEHDVEIGDHGFIGPGARLAGRVIVGDGAWVGIGATVRQGVHIGAWSLVAAGAVVVREVPPGARVAGVPARNLT